MMKCSVVLLIYNNKLRPILMTLKSIISQKFNDFEIIVADDGSKEKYLIEIEKYLRDNHSEHFSFAPSDQNVGTVKNILRALEYASGEVIKCIGAGDLLKNENALEIVYDSMEKKQAKWAFAEMTGYCINNGRIENRNFFAPLEKYPYRVNNLSLIRKKIIVCQEHISGAAMFFRKKYLEHFLRKIEDYVVYTEDIIQVLIMLEDPNILYLKDKLILYEVGSGISTSNKGPTLVDKDIERFDKYLENNYTDILVKKRLYRERVLKEFNKFYKYTYLILESPIRIVLEKYAHHPLYTRKENLGYLEDKCFYGEFKLFK